MQWHMTCKHIQVSNATHLDISIGKQRVIVLVSLFGGFLLCARGLNCCTTMVGGLGGFGDILSIHSHVTYDLDVGLNTNRDATVAQVKAGDQMWCQFGCLGAGSPSSQILPSHSPESTHYTCPARNLIWSTTRQKHCGHVEGHSRTPETRQIGHCGQTCSAHPRNKCAGS